jgi:nicotinamidase-related amidase
VAAGLAGARIDQGTKGKGRLIPESSVKTKEQVPARRRREDAGKTPRFALLLIDVINPFDFPGAEALISAAEQAAPKIASLCDRARSAGVPVIYVNDNFGRWRSDFRAIIDNCHGETSAGRRVCALLKPRASDYFVLKPLHSGFYMTVLEALLEHLEVDTLVLTGFATNLCVQFTAHDAYMRGYRLFVPEDLTASNSARLTHAALAHMREALGASTALAEALELPACTDRRRAAQ